MDFLYKQPFTLIQDSIPKKYQVGRKFDVLIPTREEWENPRAITGQEADIWYTDGSGYEGRFGAGIYRPKTDLRESIPLGKHASVFQAEVVAILRSAEYLKETNTTSARIKICSDSRAAIGAIAGHTTESSVVWDCMRALCSLGEKTKVTLVWIPGHSGIEGNERADELAKAGALEEPLNQAVGMPFAEGKLSIKRMAQRAHKTRWKANTNCRQAKLLMGEPQQERTRDLLALDRGRLSKAVGLLTGHTGVKVHLKRLNLATQDTCRLCEIDKEDSEHILCHCPGLACRRYSICGQMFLNPEGLRKLKVGQILGITANVKLSI